DSQTVDIIDSIADTVVSRFPITDQISALTFGVDPGQIALPAAASLMATPNPIPVCDGSGAGQTTLTWNAPVGSAVEIHQSTPDGLLITSGSASGSFTAGNTVTDGTVFLLQDVSNGKPLIAANTLATLTVHVTTPGLSFVANPN